MWDTVIIGLFVAAVSSFCAWALGTARYEPAGPDQHRALVAAYEAILLSDAHNHALLCLLATKATESAADPDEQRLWQERAQVQWQHMRDSRPPAWNRW
jgi:hypothetical protein